ncbi:MAG TPA: signal recognition particle-docking protein FtsY [Bacteroidetes bacterium]|nr:signal recognition particle-docking protein FtsY [Bacteroidota bacterium]
MNLLQRFKTGLDRTRSHTVARIARIFKGGAIGESVLDEVEEALLEADVGVESTEMLIDNMRRYLTGSDARKKGNPVELLKADLVGIFDDTSRNGSRRFSCKPWVILLVGVNGSGKTTTAGKLSHHFRLQGKSTVIAAADTFRAAAVEQIEEWARRGGARLVKQQTGADPAAVAFDAYQSARSRGEDLLIVDTAGRLQAKRNLMEELAKISRVLKQQDPSAPHEVILVLDATTGQNGISQALGFTEAAGGTGIIVTKLDGTARGGVVIPIHKELGLPVEFIGLGEGLDDLQPFDAGLFVDAMLEA